MFFTPDGTSLGCRVQGNDPLSLCDGEGNQVPRFKFKHVRRCAGEPRDGLMKCACFPVYRCSLNEREIIRYVEQNGRTPPAIMGRMRPFNVYAQHFSCSHLGRYNYSNKLLCKNLQI